MDEISSTILQLAFAFSLIAGFLTWLLRGLLCSAQHNVDGTQAVLITGCDTGIGHEVARHLDLLGCHVFAGCLDTASEGAQRLRVEASPRLKLVNMDVTREEHVKMAVAYIEENLPPGCEGLWAVINNAGVCVCGEFDWQTVDQIERQVEVNVVGTLRVTKMCLPLLKRGQGRLLNVSSVAGVYGYPGLSVYCATKHAVEGFSQVLRLELAKFGVDVVTIQPGDFSKATNLLNNHHRNMNQMWGDMTDDNREEYKQFFLAYHDTVAKSGFTGHRIKPLSVLPSSLISGFELALLAKVPDKMYRLMPTWRTRIKMIILGFVPGGWVQSFMHRRYTKSIPPVLVRYGRKNNMNYTVNM
eukprot:GFUD01023493.1.p1 GENE.GFUD01023493.1~~GFUD01023493.1.p1  ORF type:complete len:356 (+),score=119.13 GFUD01023493.1:51-1118(+)